MEFFEQYRKKYIPELFTASLEKDNVKKILEISKQSGLTVNELVASAFSANLLTVDVITVNDKLNFCLRYNETEIKTDIVKVIYKRAVELILKVN